MDDGTACLSDFGLSGMISQFFATSNFTSTISGNIRWGAPELFAIPDAQDGTSANRPSKECDIYSFGSIMLQVRHVLVCGPKCPLKYFFMSGSLRESSLLLYQADDSSHFAGGGWQQT
jgi:serine/threonine protein kinase